MDITTIGVLVGLAKTLVDTMKGIGDLMSTRKSFLGGDTGKAEFEKLKENVKLFYQRLDTLTEQLEKSELLVRIVEAWLQVIHRMSIPSSLEKSSDDEAKSIYEDLRDFLRDTSSDYFSGAFFRTDFRQFPTVETDLNVFRSNLDQLKATVNSITPQNMAVFKLQWPVITTQLNNLRNSGSQVSQTVSQVHEQLIQELRDAAKQQ